MQIVVRGQAGAIAGIGLRTERAVALVEPEAPGSLAGAGDVVVEPQRLRVGQGAAGARVLPVAGSRSAAMVAKTSGRPEASRVALMEPNVPRETTTQWVPEKAGSYS